MTSPVLVFDTSIYIPYLRSEAYGALLDRAARSGRVRLSAVVLSELYAGTRSQQDKADLDTVSRSYGALGYLVTPSTEDWALAGQAIRRHRSLHGDIVPSEHMHDLLILLSAARAGAVVVTENAAHFSRWATIVRRMGVSARVQAVRHEDHLG
jgi:predicted nucleic acid-binding protein